MNRRTSIAVLALSLGSAAVMATAARASDDWRDIKVDPGSLFYSEKSVKVRGSWKPAGDYKHPRVSKLNSFAIHCERAENTCYESQAQVHLLRISEPGSPPHLQAFGFEYQILQWSREAIVAKHVDRRGSPMDMTLTIDSKNGYVRVEWKDKPEAEGWFVPVEQQFEMRTHNHWGGNEPGSFEQGAREHAREVPLSLQDAESGG